MTNEFDAVVDYLAEKGSSGKRDIPGRIVQGHAHLLMGNRSEAFREFEIADSEIVEEPFHSHVAAMLSSIFIQEHDFQSALAWANRAIKRNDQAPAGYFFRGVAYRKMKEYENAVHDFETAISLGDDSITLIEELICAHVDGRNVASALHFIDRLPAETKNHSIVAYQRARVTELDWTNKSRREDARKLYEHALALQPNEVYRQKIMSALKHLSVP